MKSEQGKRLEPVRLAVPVVVGVCMSVFLFMMVTSTTPIEVGLYGFGVFAMGSIFVIGIVSIKWRRMWYASEERLQRLERDVEKLKRTNPAE